jgi:hypothetical protein
MKSATKRESVNSSSSAAANTMSSATGRRSVRISSEGGNVKSSYGLTNQFSKSGNYASSTDFGDDARTLMERLQSVKDDLRATQENFISRERAYQLRIEELEVALLKKRQAKIGWMKSHPKISKLKSMQSQILSNVALVQDRFSRVMQEQEHDLLRAFQARLLDVQAQLEMQKSKQDDGAVAYIELSKVKEYDVEKEKVRADLKERQNQALLQGNNRLKNQFTSREEDRNFLVLQINAARQDNARLRAEHEEHDVERGKLEAEVRYLHTSIRAYEHTSIRAYDIRLAH